MLLIQTVDDIKARLQNADQEELAVMERALEADTRKGVIVALERARRRIEAQQREEQRLRSLYEYEDSLTAGKMALGLDEVGRGSVAGPLAVGAVVLNKDSHICGLDDSKKIAAPMREAIAAEIKEKAVFWTVCYVEAEEIDAVGMSACLRIAFRRAIAACETSGVIPETILLDGNALSLDEREINVVKGDARCASIAAASIVAKVERDSLMKSLAEKYPAYGFDASKGYASADHIAAIQTYGLSPQHRKSFCTSFLQEKLF
ncbi:MAG: ribonuclease HII [Raoultibacter sp.]